MNLIRKNTGYCRLLYWCLYGKTKAQGIDFYASRHFLEPGVAKTARDSNKLIFVDVYAEWCGPTWRRGQENISTGSSW